MRGIVVQGEAVRAARLQRGLTQTDLARITGLDVKTVRKAERGKRVDLIPLSRLAHALNTDLGRLIVSDDDDADLTSRRRDAVVQWAGAFDAHDIVALLSVYCDDAVLRLPGGPNVPFGGTFRGKEEIRKAHEDAWSTTRQEPIRLEEMSLHAGDSAVTLQGNKGTYLPNGELVRFPCLQIFKFADELICEHEVWFDTLDFARRLNFAN